jgi:hypothetical protein
MQLSSAPIQIQLPFANGDVTKTNPIPVPSSGTPGAASFTDGFPPITGQPVSSGGIPPSKADFNGIFYELSNIDRWMSAGAGFKFSSVYAAAIGGYPKGARVLNAAGNGYWRSLADNNSNNPDTTGISWMAEWRAVASVYASAQQTILSGGAKVVWDTVEYDDFGMWNAADKAFKAPWPGKYRLSGAVYLPSAAAQNLSVQVMLNASLYKQYFQAPQVSSVPLSLPFDVIINAGSLDEFQVDLVAGSSSVLAGQAGSNQAYVFGQLEYLGS